LIINLVDCPGRANQPEAPGLTTGDGFANLRYVAKPDYSIMLVNAQLIGTLLLDVVFGKYKPHGHLPIELPSSMEADRNQKEDVPYDTKDPLYKFGYGLNY
jgi:hypothetical protein